MRVITFGSAQSGSGKSFIAANLGLALAQRGVRTCLVDLDLNSADLHLMLGSLSPKRGLSELLRGDARALVDVVFPIEGTGGRLHLVPGVSETMRDLDAEEVQGLCDDIRQLPYDVVLVDISAGSGARRLDLFLGGDEQWVIATPQPRAIDLARGFVRRARLRRVACDAGPPPRKPRIYSSIDDLVRDMSAIRRREGGQSTALPQLVLNRCRAEVLEENVDEWNDDEELTLPIAEIPEDPFVARSIKSLAPLVAHHPGAAASRAIVELSQRVAATLSSVTTAEEADHLAPLAP